MVEDGKAVDQGGAHAIPPARGEGSPEAVEGHGAMAGRCPFTMLRMVPFHHGGGRASTTRPSPPRHRLGLGITEALAVKSVECLTHAVANIDLDR